MEVGKRVGEKGGGEEVSYRNSFNARQRLQRAGGVSSQRKKKENRAPPKRLGRRRCGRRYASPFRTGIELDMF